MKPLGETIEASDVTPHYASNSVCPSSRSTSFPPLQPHTYGLSLIRRFVQRTKELVALVKAQIAELVDIAGSVRLWLQFSIPPAGGQDFDAKIKAHGSPLHRL
jgi:hypothetical protein